MNNTGFSKGDILVPNVENMTAWSVIACDQYTSQPQYWHEVADFVKTRPSTLNMIVPEINLNSEDLDQHIGAVNRAMRTYLRRHVFFEVHDYIYTRRILHNGKVMCHKTCEELLHSGYTVSGKQSEVDAFIAGKQVLSQQSIGGLKTAVIYGQPEKDLPETLETGRMDLQKLFVAMTEENGRDFI